MVASDPRSAGAASWASVLEPDTRARAIRIAREVVIRASDPGRISEALGAAGHQTMFPQSLRWEPYGIASGDAGIALVCGYADACLPGDGWEREGHDYVAAAAYGAEQTDTLRPGLFAGLSGLAFAVASLSRGGTRYGRLLAALDDRLAPDALALATRLRSTGRAVPVSAFDVISGASGVGAYLLLRDPHGVLPEILTALVSLAAESDRPRWWTPAELLEETMARAQPWGNLNCGLAHGIPGPLALLALAKQAGHVVPGQVEAVRRLAEWLVAHEMRDEWGPYWPSVIPLSSAGAPSIGAAASTSTRDAWCYGSPGVARALWLAGEALNDARFRRHAVDAMLAVLRRPKAKQSIESPTFCHGVAGLLQIVLRFARDTGMDVFAGGASALVAELLGAYEHARPLGYASLEPGGNPVDRPGLLDGAPGVAMTLLAAATDVEPSWDRLFLLS